MRREALMKMTFQKMQTPATLADVDPNEDAEMISICGPVRSELDYTGTARGGVCAGINDGVAIAASGSPTTVTGKYGVFSINRGITGN